jgi:hypothetical protein
MSDGNEETPVKSVNTEPILPMSLSYIKEQEEQLLFQLAHVDTMEEENVAILSKEITQFYLQSYQTHLAELISDDDYQQHRDGYIHDFLPILIEKIHSITTPSRAASLLECAYLLESNAFNSDGNKIEALIESFTDPDHIPLLRDLLHSPSQIGYVVVDSIEKGTNGRLSNMTDEQKVSMLPMLIEGLSHFSIEQAVKSGFETLTTENMLIAWTLEQYDAVQPPFKWRESDLEEITRVAENYVGYFYESRDRIQAGYPSHGATNSIVTLLDKLFSNRGPHTPAIPPELREYLEILYMNKVVRFSAGKTKGYLYAPFMKLIHTLNYDETSFIQAAENRKQKESHQNGELHILSIRDH